MTLNTPLLAMLKMLVPGWLPGGALHAPAAAAMARACFPMLLHPGLTLNVAGWTLTCVLQAAAVRAANSAEGRSGAVKWWVRVDPSTLPPRAPSLSSVVVLLSLTHAACRSAAAARMRHHTVTSS